MIILSITKKAWDIFKNNLTLSTDLISRNIDIKFLEYYKRELEGQWGTSWREEFGKTHKMKSSKLPSWSTGSISGPGSHPSSRGNQPNNASRDGMSGSIPASRKLSGAGQKTKNCCNWPGYSHLNGGRSRPLLEGLQLSVSKDMKNCSIWLKENQHKNQRIWKSFDQDKSIPTLRQNPHALTRSIWMKTKKKCWQKFVFV